MAEKRQSQTRPARASHVGTALATLIIAVGIGLLAGLAVIYSGSYNMAADAPHWRLVSRLLETMRVRSVKAHAAGITVPADFDDPSHLLVGAEHFATHCALCHGAPGVEADDLADGLYPPPPSLKFAASRFTPPELFWIVKHGIKMSGMPAWGDHSDDELWAVVALIEKLPNMPDAEYGELVMRSMKEGGHYHHSAGEPAPGEAGSGQP